MNKKVKKRQAKMYKELTDAKYKLNKALASVDKYRKRCFRLSKKLSPTDSPKTKALHQSHIPTTN